MPCHATNLSNDSFICQATLYKHFHLIPTYSDSIHSFTFTLPLSAPLVTHAWFTLHYIHEYCNIVNVWIVFKNKVSHDGLPRSHILMVLSYDPLTKHTLLPHSTTSREDILSVWALIVCCNTVIAIYIPQFDHSSVISNGSSSAVRGYWEGISLSLWSLCTTGAGWADPVTDPVLLWEDTDIESSSLWSIYFMYSLWSLCFM